MPVVAVCFKVLIKPDDCLVFEGFENRIADFWEHAVVFGVAFDELRHLFSCGQIFDYQPKDGFGKVQALYLVAGHGSGDWDIEHPAQVFGGVGFRFARHLEITPRLFVENHAFDCPLSFSEIVQIMIWPLEPDMLITNSGEWYFSLYTLCIDPRLYERSIFRSGGFI